MPKPFSAPLLAAGGLALLLGLAARAEAQIPKVEKANLALHTDRTAYTAGSTVKVEALVTIEAGWHVNAHKPTFEYLIPTELDLALPEGWAAETVTYPEAHKETFAFADQPLAVYDGSFIIRASFTVPAGTKDGDIAIQGTLHYQSCDKKQCLPPVSTVRPLQLKVGPGGKPNPAFSKSGAGTPAGPGAGAAGGGAPHGLGFMLALAVLGGLILNAMPCVLPILSLKVFGLVHSAGHGRGGVAAGALATAAGILISFWILAGAAIAAAAAGSAVGWGVQFQQPAFVTFLVVVVVLFCLNLWGLFEIQLPMALARIGASGPREGVAGHFASGLFATLMATPCSAPFLGTAVGFALAQKAPVILAIFTAVGLGMALPYLLLAAFPATARILPKPGAWMDTVKGVMGFLMAGAAVWLFYVLSGQVSPERLAGIKLAILGIAFFVWLWQRGGLSPTVRRAVATCTLAVVALPIVLAAASRAQSAPATAKPAGLIHWETFDRPRAEELAGSGRLVFVDVTADWCFTCKVNERLVLDTPETAALFTKHQVLPMKADWTNRNDEIGKFLAEHGKYGIPFYLLYRPGNPPHVFSELISKEALAEVVAQADAPGGKDVATS